MTYRKIHVPDEVAYATPYDNEYHLNRLHGRHPGEPWRGPHAGKAFYLMTLTDKPMTIVNEGEGMEFLNRGWQGLSVFEMIVRERFREWIITKPGEEYRVDLLLRTMNTPMDLSVYHARMGLLLGYSKTQIRRFIEDVRGRHPEGCRWPGSSNRLIGRVYEDYRGPIERSSRGGRSREACQASSGVRAS